MAIFHNSGIHSWVSCDEGCCTKVADLFNPRYLASTDSCKEYMIELAAEVDAEHTRKNQTFPNL